MFAPSAAARSAIARPMPRLPPDIRMVLPASGLGGRGAELTGSPSGRTACGMPRRTPRRGASTRRCRSGRRSWPPRRRGSGRTVRSGADADEALGLPERRGRARRARSARRPRRDAATSAAGTTSATRPQSSASAALSVRSCSSSCSARRWPIAAGSSVETPRSGVRPMLAYLLTNFAAVRRRRCSRRVSMRPSPPPATAPCTAATIGLSEHSTSVRMPSWITARPPVTASPPAPEAAIATTSPPAQKAGPAASRITAPIDASRGDLRGDVAPARAHLEVHRVERRRAVEGDAREAAVAREEDRVAHASSLIFGAMRIAPSSRIVSPLR